MGKYGMGQEWQPRGHGHHVRVVGERRVWPFRGVGHSGCGRILPACPSSTETGLGIHCIVSALGSRAHCMLSRPFSLGPAASAAAALRSSLARGLQQNRAPGPALAPPRVHTNHDGGPAATHCVRVPRRGAHPGRALVRGNIWVPIYGDVEQTLPGRHAGIGGRTPKSHHPPPTTVHRAWSGAIDTRTTALIPRKPNSLLFFWACKTGMEMRKFLTRRRPKNIHAARCPNDAARGVEGCELYVCGAWRSAPPCPPTYIGVRMLSMTARGQVQSA